jgi:hypothetical protein
LKGDQIIELAIGAPGSAFQPGRKHVASQTAHQARSSADYGSDQ